MIRRHTNCIINNNLHRYTIVVRLSKVRSCDPLKRKTVVHILGVNNSSNITIDQKKFMLMIL